MRVVIQRPVAQSAKGSHANNWDSALFEVELRPLLFAKNVFVVEQLKELYRSVEADQSKLPILHKGYFDSHLHAIGMGLISQELALGEFRDWETFIGQIKKRAGVEPHALRAFGWDESHVQMSLESFVRKLESEIPENVPIALYRVCGHSAFVNRAFRKKIGMATHGALMTDRHLEKVNHFFAAPSVDECERAFLESQKSLLNYGITAIGEMSVDATMIEALKNICRRGDLIVDVQACFDAGKGGEVERQGPLEMQNSAPLGPLDRPARLSVKHWKKYLDGSFGSRTAWLTQSYQDQETFGDSLIGISALLNEAKQALDKGFYLSFHCIGDAAVDQALEVGDRLERACRDRMISDQKLGGAFSCHRLEHAQLIRPDQLERMARQKLWTLCVQPGHRLADAPFIESRLGRERARSSAYRAGSLKDHGVAFGLGSDAPVDVLDPQHVIRAAMTHPVHSEKLSFSEAVWAYTTGSRLALGLDPASIGVGSTVFLSEFPENLSF